MSERTILALGGNAFATPGQPLTMARQFEFAHRACLALSPLLDEERELVISHGNGPQVGHILLRVEEALGKAYAIPLEVCVAESEGELGYVMSQSLHNALAKMGRRRLIASILTQVIVNPDDDAFQHPTKPIGPYYTEAEAEAVRGRGFHLAAFSGRGLRRVVPSPKPCEILEAELIENLLRSKAVVVAAGGGGIPVVRKGNQLHGVEAVVDKDLTSALLGEVIDAQLLVLLTDVPCAYREFSGPNPTPIGLITACETEELLQAGHFAEGSMKPKVLAALEFSRRSGCRAIICNVENLAEAIEGTAGTIIESDDG